MNKRLFILAVCFAALSITGCNFNFASFDWDDYKYTFDDSIEDSADGIERVQIIIRNGKIELKGNESDAISIAIEERIKANDEDAAKIIADEVSLKGERQNNTMVYTIDYSGKKQEYKNKFACVLAINLPEDVEIDLESTNGLISIAWMKADATVQTTNGKVIASNCDADVNLRTTNGGINASNIDGSIEAGTTNGGIEIVSNSAVKASTTNGGIRVTISSEMMGDISLNTTNGGVNLKLPESSEFELDASTTNGKVRSSFSGDLESNRRNTSLRGTVGSAAHKVRLSTTNGNININKE